MRLCEQDDGEKGASTHARLHGLRTASVADGRVGRVKVWEAAWRHRPDQRRDLQVEQFNKADGSDGSAYNIGLGHVKP
jgi:hypothetical protein